MFAVPFQKAPSSPISIADCTHEISSKRDATPKLHLHEKEDVERCSLYPVDLFRVTTDRTRPRLAKKQLDIILSNVEGGSRCEVDDAVPARMSSQPCPYVVESQFSLIHIALSTKVY